MKYRLVHQQARENAAEACYRAPDGYIVDIKEETRTAAQNRKMWPMLKDIRKTGLWCGRDLSTTSWKEMLTASLRGSETVPNADGTGFVSIGVSTSGMGKSEFANLIEFMYAFGAARGAEWSEKSIDLYEEEHKWLIKNDAAQAAKNTSI